MVPGLGGGRTVSRMSESPPRPRRQEQERASSDVVEVAPGILRAQLPIDMPGLGHTNCYVIEDERGVAVVDPGLPGKATLEVLTDRLASAGIPLARVHTVVVTHSHPDHFGGAGWIRRETGADIVTHRRFSFIWDRFDPPDLDVEEMAAMPPADAAPDEAAAGKRRNPWDPPPWGGEAYGFSVENAYVEDRETGRALFLAATIYTNADGVLNDDRYEYAEVAKPFFALLGEALGRELLRQR